MQKLFTTKGYASNLIQVGIVKKTDPCVLSNIQNRLLLLWGDKPELSFTLDPSTNSREITEAKLKTPSDANITLNTHEIENLSSGNLPKGLSGFLVRKIVGSIL
ncbi:hypothetical protein [Bacteroidetes bacterium endosymbiont of Geopemphigus sp.]|uniref:hypothetical protein n=1 Tax=Bacteroidetes bacterium endosymbiont of Geopemphigus sp. TaxID=2047937 RepID=UPI000CD1881B|nr:hypothetical protein [Bacteroidetes bacterium endosymbiont of Geopemphigus sp.]